MSSYHSSFSYLGKNSKDFGWIITSFDADSGEQDSYLSQEQVYTDSYNGAKRILYGTHWNAVATIKITVIKKDHSEFSEAECRSAYRWLTGNPTATWLDLYKGDTIRYSFSCTAQDVKPYKLDARTIGLIIYFESTSPWAYSPEIKETYAFGQTLLTDENGVLNGNLSVSNDGILSANNNNIFNVTTDGVAYIDNPTAISIDNPSDDLYSYVYLDITYTNGNSDNLTIKNQTLYDKTNGRDGITEITGMAINEVIKLNANQFIVSDAPNKIFGDSFNFVWPKLIPGNNDIAINGDGDGIVEFTYRYPIKIGDCAIDAFESDDCDV